MKKTILALALMAAAGGANGALAQSPAAFNWTGYYVGGYAGYGWGRSEATESATITAMAG